MKIFIAGARSVKNLDDKVKAKLISIFAKGFDVLVGDCYGVDTAVQSFYKELGYNNIIVYASNGKTRNNIGNWPVKNVPVPPSAKGFEFYKQKDIAMANDADYGFMIWDGKSRGTLNNVVNLVKQNKKVLIYMTIFREMFVIGNIEQLNTLIKACPKQTQDIYRSLF